jgi:hypothetical protein
MGIFVAAFLLECAGAAYTIMLTDRRAVGAVIFSFIHEALSWLIVLVVVQDFSNAPAAVLGNVLGTVMVLKCAPGAKKSP